MTPPEGTPECQTCHEPLCDHGMHRRYCRRCPDPKDIRLAEAEKRVGELEGGISAAWWEIRAILSSKDRPDFVAGATWANAVLETAVRSRVHDDWYRICELAKSPRSGSGASHAVHETSPPRAGSPDEETTRLEPGGSPAGGANEPVSSSSGCGGRT